MAPILKEVGDILQTFHLYSFDMVQILNDCTCVTLIVLYRVIACQNQTGNHHFLSWRIPALNNNPAFPLMDASKLQGLKQTQTLNLPEIMFTLK